MNKRRERVTMLIATSIAVILCVYLIFYGIGQEGKREPMELSFSREKYLGELEYDRAVMDLNKVITVEPNPKRLWNE